MVESSRERSRALKREIEVVHGKVMLQEGSLEPRTFLRWMVYNDNEEEFISMVDSIALRSRTEEN